MCRLNRSKYIVLPSCWQYRRIYCYKCVRFRSIGCMCCVCVCVERSTRVSLYVLRPMYSKQKMTISYFFFIHSTESRKNVWHTLIALKWIYSHCHSFIHANYLMNGTAFHLTFWQNLIRFLCWKQSVETAYLLIHFAIANITIFLHVHFRGYLLWLTCAHWACISICVMPKNRKFHSLGVRM